MTRLLILTTFFGCRALQLQMVVTDSACARQMLNVVCLHYSTIITLSLLLTALCSALVRYFCVDFCARLAQVWVVAVVD